MESLKEISIDDFIEKGFMNVVSCNQFHKPIIGNGVGKKATDMYFNISEIKSFYRTVSAVMEKVRQGNDFTD